MHDVICKTFSYVIFCEKGWSLPERRPLIRLHNQVNISDKYWTRMELVGHSKLVCFKPSSIIKIKELTL
jgi:hypothetical protein